MRAFEQLPGYLRAIKVGLTPYSMSAFNQSSYPLKTLEYLAAGRAVVTTDLPSARIFPDKLVVRVANQDFVSSVGAELERRDSVEDISRRRNFATEHSWPVRATEFLNAIGY